MPVEPLDFDQELAQMKQLKEDVAYLTSVVFLKLNEEIERGNRLEEELKKVKNRLKYAEFTLKEGVA